MQVFGEKPRKVRRGKINKQIFMTELKVIHFSIWDCLSKSAIGYLYLLFVGQGIRVFYRK